MEVVGQPGPLVHAEGWPKLLLNLAGGEGGTPGQGSHVIRLRDAKWAATAGDYLITLDFYLPKVCKAIERYCRIICLANVHRISLGQFVECIFWPKNCIVLGIEDISKKYYELWSKTKLDLSPLIFKWDRSRSNSQQSTYWSDIKNLGWKLRYILVIFGRVGVPITNIIIGPLLIFFDGMHMKNAFYHKPIS